MVINMASFKNFQSKNQKHSNLNSRTNHDAGFNSPVSAKSDAQVSSFEKHLDKYVDFCSWLIW